MRQQLRLAIACVAFAWLSVASAQAPTTSYQGIWWAAPAGSESGWGINFTHQGDVVFATWFTYDANGRPLWLVAAMQRQAGTATFSGDLFQTTGPVFSATPFDPAKVTETKVGTMSVTFQDPTTATLTYSVGLATQSKTITPQVFRTLPSCRLSTLAELASAGNYQGLWWAAPAGSESGWGVNFAHQDEVIFATWFTYDADNQPLWLVASLTAEPDRSFVGELYRTTGPAFNAVPFDPAKVQETDVGAAKVVFASGNSGAFTYTVNGVTQTKVITQQVFDARVTVCEPASTDAEVEADIVRLLEQSTMGPTEALIAEVKQKGMVPWLDEQLELYESRYTAWPPYYRRDDGRARPVCPGSGLRPQHLLAGPGRLGILPAGAGWARSGSPALLRTRCTSCSWWASVEQRETYAIGNHQQRVRDFAFSTYEEALYQYSISPQLGYFQGWANNVPEHDGIKPNENYAREILQLLTTGVNRLNEDGTEQLDGAGNPVPAYEQADVTALSRVFTGFTYRLIPGMPGPQYFPVNAGLSLGPDGAIRSVPRPGREEPVRRHGATAGGPGCRCGRPRGDSRAGGATPTRRRSSAGN